MDQFVGTFEHSLDDKGRVVLPKKFREAFTGSSGFLSQYDRCLGLWSEEGFADLARRLTEKIREGLAPQDALRAFSSVAEEVRPDSQGRITIPQRLRDVADLQGETVLIGAYHRIEIWNADRWRAQAPAANHSLGQALSALGL